MEAWVCLVDLGTRRMRWRGLVMLRAVRMMPFEFGQVGEGLMSQVYVSW